MTADYVSGNGPDGTIVGKAGTGVGAYGTTPVLQPFGADQAALSRAAQSGVVTTFGSTQSATAVLTITSTESNMTLTPGSGATNVLAANDMVYVNKLAQQAGLGVGNVRVGSAGVAAVNFSNPTASTVTPTTSEVWKAVSVRGVGLLSAALTPVAVAANSVVEQTFAVPGVFVGGLVQVSKPTAQAGLDIGGCRVISNGVIGITFTNVTAAPITPTAAETYLVNCLSGLDAVNNDVFYGYDVGTVGAITAGVVVSGGSTALAGVLATDTINGIFKPTPQATATNIATPAYAIPTTDTLTLYFLGTGTGSTPTASEVYGIRSTRLAPNAPLKLYSQTLTPVSVAANTCAEQTFTVTGLVANSVVHVNKVSSATPGLAIMGVRVSALNTLAINYMNTTAVAIVPPSEVYTIGNFQAVSPGAKNHVYQVASAWANNVGNLLNALRKALVGIGFVAGA